MQNWKKALLATVTLACVGLAEQANAQVLYGAGATFPSVTYRKLFDCLYKPADGVPGGPTPALAISPNCPSGSGDASGFGSLAGAQILYAPTGSGNGKLSFRTNNPASITTPSPASTVPYTSTGNPFPYAKVHFGGSDDTWNSSDAATWVSLGNPGKFGNPIVIPALVGNVTVAINGKDGTGAALNITNPVPVGGSSGLNLSRKAFCGIFAGHITKWDNPILTALNGGVPLGTGNITVIHRRDGSGTTFVFANALTEQCEQEFGPTNETTPALTLYNFKWTDRGVAASQCPALPVRGANLLNWPTLGTSQCGTAIANPGGGIFTQPATSGNAANIALLQATNGSVTYTTTDFIQPFVATGPVSANLQNQYDIDNATGQFQPATTSGAQIAMSSSVPILDSVTRKNPLNWARQGVVPNPSLQGSFPIAGFTWFMFYQCYSRSSGDPIPFINFMLDYVYSPTATPLLDEFGFAQVPAVWLNEVFALKNDDTANFKYVDQGVCLANGVTPGAAN